MGSLNFDPHHHPAHQRASPSPLNPASAQGTSRKRRLHFRWGEAGKRTRAPGERAGPGHQARELEPGTSREGWTRAPGGGGAAAQVNRKRPLASWCTVNMEPPGLVHTAWVRSLLWTARRHDARAVQIFNTRIRGPSTQVYVDPQPTYTWTLNSGIRGPSTHIYVDPQLTYTWTLNSRTRGPSSHVHVDPHLT